MRLLCLTLVLLISTTAIAQQQDVPTTNIGTNAGNAGGNQNSGGGSSQVPAGFGGGGQSDNLNAVLGERGTANQAAGFIGGNQNAQQGGFVGQNQTTLNGGQQNNQRGQFGNFGGAQNGGRGGGQQQQRAPRRIRTRLVLPTDFAAAYRIVPAARLQSNLSGQYRAIDASQAKSKVSLGSSRVFAGANIQVAATGRIVTLRGQVGSDRERKLAERIAKLEPGVDRVENLLTVTGMSR